MVLLHGREGETTDHGIESYVHYSVTAEWKAIARMSAGFAT